MKFSSIATLALAAMPLLASCCKTGCDSTGDCTATDSIDNHGAIRLNVFYIANGDADINQLKAVADSLVRASRTDAGCITYDFLENTVDPGQYMIIETWENDSLLQLHSQAPHFTRFVPQLKAMGTMSTQRFNLPRQ